MNSATPEVEKISVQSPAPPSLPQRLVSLDVFRGMTIASMMMVNNAGDWNNTYAPLRHSDWHGWTFTDTIFPFFLWIVGVAIPFSLLRRMETEPRGELIAKILRRSAILFFIGVFLNGFGDLFNAVFGKEGFGYWMQHLVDTIRIPGVLQRIAICYLITSLIVLRTSIRGQIIWTAALLFFYAVLMKCFSMPGFAAGDLTKEGNFSHFIDSLLLKNHMWAKSKTWDPEGTISTLPAIATCLFGVLTGHVLRSARTAAEKTATIATTGALLMFAAQIMDWFLPINKPLWTSSYSVFMAGLAMTVFAVCYWLVDVRGWQKPFKPLAIYGMNAITVFVLAGIFGRLSLEIKVAGITGEKIPLKTFLYDKFFASLAAPGGIFHTLTPENALKNSSLLWALMYVFGLYFIAWVLYRRKWFIRF